MDEYRIVTKNGRFRVQRRLLWWWLFCREYVGNGSGKAVEFKCREGAQEWIDDRLARTEQELAPWEPV